MPAVFGGTWMKLIAGLKREFPAQHAVRVRRRAMKRSEAVTITHPGRTTIYISSDLDFNKAFDALVHEYAHVLDGHERFDCDDSAHSETWGVCYARVYKYAIKFMEVHGDDE